MIEMRTFKPVQERRKMSVLVIEDYQPNRELLRDILEPEFSVMLAANGNEGLQLARNAISPDLILLDINMPGINGFTLCEKLKKDRKTRKIPIIFVTANHDSDIEERGLSLGAADFITKPFVPSLILARVRNHLQLARTLEELDQVRHKTFVGAIRILTDILALSCPEAFSRSLRLKRLVKQVALKLKVSGVWRYEVAASLSQIGCIHLSENVIRKVCQGKALSEDELAEYRTYPEKSYQMLVNIPQLEESAEMIRRLVLCEQPEYFADRQKGDLSVSHALLQTVLYFDEQKSEGKPVDAIVELMRKHFPKPIVQTISEIEEEDRQRAEEIKLDDLREGMILAADLLSEAGLVLIPSGSELTSTLVDRLKNNWCQKTTERVRVIREAA